MVPTDILRSMEDDVRVKRQPLPGLLGKIEEVIGLRGAERFAIAFGGSELIIPKNVGEDHPIYICLGPDDAKAVCDNFAYAGSQDGGQWFVPTGEIELKWNVARRMRLSGASRNVIVHVLRTYYGFATTTKRVGCAISDLDVPTMKTRTRSSSETKEAAKRRIARFL